MADNDLWLMASKDLWLMASNDLWLMANNVCNRVAISPGNNILRNKVIAIREAAKKSKVLL